jgi:hypothetical protein
MQRTVSSDRFTLIAIAVVAYACVNVCHEIAGHCSVAALLGARCRLLSSTYIPLVKGITEIPAWKYAVILAAGSAANWALGLVCLGSLRALRGAPPTLRYFLWLLMCVNLFLPSSYMAAAQIIRYGDAYFLISNLPGEIVWRIALVIFGGALVWLSFRLCLAELRRLVGFGGAAARSVAWRLVVPAYVAGGVVTVASGLFSQLEFKWAQLQAAGGSFGLTVWLLILPLGIPELPDSAGRPFVLPRSIKWIAGGALAAAVFIGALGPGIPL